MEHTTVLLFALIGFVILVVPALALLATLYYFLIRRF